MLFWQAAAILVLAVFVGLPSAAWWRGERW